MRTELSSGCRGFNGPFPLPLWMSGMQLWQVLSDRASHGCGTLSMAAWQSPDP
ncbi:MAG: hypothetical protein QG597_2901 [Actinomycetota bacterium]|nr:hypothetical protein [Actinomycetota bacterium]